MTVERLEVTFPDFYIQSREMGFDTRLHTDMASQLKKIWREAFGTLQLTERQLLKAQHSEASCEATVGPDEAEKLEELGIKAGVAVDVRIEWPPGCVKKKWIPTKVTRVSRKKGYFQVEVDAGAEEQGTKFRFLADSMDKEWRFSALCGSASKGSGKQDISADVQEQEPYIGARIEVLFDVDGKTDWYGGKVTRKEKKGAWAVLFDDGDEDLITWPDPKGEVRITSSKKKRNQTRASKEDREGKVERSGKAGQSPGRFRLRTGDFCRVLFEDGIKYLGIVTGKDVETEEVVIVFEDGEEHRVVLPDRDVFEASIEDALAEWVDEHGETKFPWFNAHKLGHTLEDGEFDTEVPENWSRVILCPPKKPKRASSKRQRARQSASGDLGEGMRMEAAGNQDNHVAEMSKKKSAKTQGKGAEEAAQEDVGKDGKLKDSKSSKRHASDLDSQTQATEQSKKKSSSAAREGRKPRDRHQENLIRKQREGQSKAQQELADILLQHIEDEVLQDNDRNEDFVDAMSIFLAQTESLNLKDFCLVCGSSPTKEEVLYCRDCGDCFHAYCAMDTRVRKIPKEKRHTWRCPACRICEVCKGEEDWENIMCCDECDRGFHTFCLKPAVKDIPKDGWKCNDCVQCISCGLRNHGTRKDIWRKDCTYCKTCFEYYEKKQYCPLCKVVWSKEDNNERAVCCDTCNMWVHPACAGISESKYLAMQEDEEPWNCPKCSGDLDESDEEEVKKTFTLPTADRVVENQRQFEDFCHTRLKILQRTCDAVERVYQPWQSEANPQASQDPTPLHPELSSDVEPPVCKPAASADDNGQTITDDNGLPTTAGASGLADDEASAVPSPDASADASAVPGVKSFSDKPASQESSSEHADAGEADACGTWRHSDPSTALNREAEVHARNGAGGHAGAAVEAQSIAGEAGMVTGTDQDGSSVSSANGTVAERAAEKDETDRAPLLVAENRADGGAGNDGDVEGEVHRAADTTPVHTSCGKSDEILGDACNVASQEQEQIDKAASDNIKQEVSCKDAGAASVEKEPWIDVRELEALETAAKDLNADEKNEKMAVLAKLKKDLFKIEKAIEKHKYLELVQFFDEVIKTLDDEDRFGGIQREIYFVRRQAIEAMPNAAKRSSLSGLPVLAPLILTNERLWAKQATATAGASASFIRQMLPAFVDDFTRTDTSSAAAMVAQQQRAHLEAHRRIAAQRKKVAQKRFVEPVQGSELLSRMSQFYHKIKAVLEQDAAANDVLLRHLRESGLCTAPCLGVMLCHWDFF